MTAQQRPTWRELDVLRVSISAGSIVCAAHRLGISESTARQHLSGMYRRTGCLNAAQAAYLLGRADTAASGEQAERREARRRTRPMHARHG